MSTSPPDFPNLRRLRRAEIDEIRRERRHELRIIARIAVAVFLLGGLVLSVLILSGIGR